MKILTQGSLKEELQCGGTGPPQWHGHPLSWLPKVIRGVPSPRRGVWKWGRCSPATLFPSMPTSGWWSGRQSSGASLHLHTYSPPGRAALGIFWLCPSPGAPGAPRFASCETIAEQECQLPGWKLGHVWIFTPAALPSLAMHDGVREDQELWTPTPDAPGEHEGRERGGGEFGACSSLGPSSSSLSSGLDLALGAELWDAAASQVPSTSLLCPACAGASAAASVGN